MAAPEYQQYFVDFEWPWYMPEAGEYEARLRQAGFREVAVKVRINDRSFNAAQLTGFIDQPAIVPFLAPVAEADKKRFRDAVLQAALEQTARGEGEYFEAFRRLEVFARK